MNLYNIIHKIIVLALHIGKCCAGSVHYGESLQAPREEKEVQY